MLSAFCKIVGIDGPYATPSSSPSPVPPSPLLPLGLAVTAVNLRRLCEETVMDSEPAMPMAPMVPSLHPVSPAPPGPLSTPSPQPPACPPAPAVMLKPTPTQPTTSCPKPTPAERQGSPKPPQGKPGPSAGEGAGRTSAEKQKAQVLPQGKGMSQLTSYHRLLTFYHHHLVFFPRPYPPLAGSPLPFICL